MRTTVWDSTTAEARATAPAWRVLLLTESYPPGRGGMAQSCDRIVHAMRALGVVVDLVHLCRRARGIEIEQQQGGRLLRCPIEDDPAHAIHLVWNALQASATAPTHVLAFGGLLPLLAAPVFAAWLDVPLVVLLRGNDFDSGLFSHRHGWILREALARSSAICVVSRMQQRRVQALFPTAAVHCIGNGVDTRLWRLEPFDLAQAQQWRRQQVAPGRRVLGLFGQLKRKKGVSLLLEALERSRLAPDFHLLIVGDVEAGMQPELDALSLRTGVSCLPFVDRYALLGWYAACDLVALPSHYDGMPNVLLEAGALGVPLLASTAGGMADLLVDGENALTFAPGDVHHCARALRRAARLPLPRLQAMGQALQQQVLQQCRPEQEARSYEDVLQRTARDTAPGAPLRDVRRPASVDGESCRPAPKLPDCSPSPLLQENQDECT